MSRHYMSVLGTSGYSECDYCIEATNERYRTKFIQAAVFSLLCKEFTSGDKITIFVTQKAKETHQEALHKELTALLQKKALEVQLQYVDIRDGMDNAQQWENFNIIYDHIEPEEEVTVDITHGYRPLPMQLFAILNFAQSLKNITVHGVYYGVFDKDSKLDYSPIVDYSSYLTITRLANAASVFSETGNAKSLHDITYSIKQEAAKSKDPCFRSFAELDKVSRKVEQLTSSIHCARGQMNSRNCSSIQKDYLAYCQERECASAVQDNTRESRAISQILQHIDSAVMSCFQDVSAETDDFTIGLRTVDWCLKYDLIQAGFTALRETVTSWMYAHVDSLEELKTMTKKDNVRDLREALFNMTNDNNGKGVDEESLQYLRKSFSEETLTALIRLCSNIRIFRNDINHFGFSSDKPNTTQKLRSHLEECYQDFLVLTEQ